MIEVPCRWGSIPSVVRNPDRATCRVLGRVQRWWNRFSCRSQSAPRPGRVIGRLCRRCRSCGTQNIRDVNEGTRFRSSAAQSAKLTSPLPPAVAILRCDCYNWAPRGRRLGHRGRVRGTPEGRRIVVCVGDSDCHRCRGRQLRLCVNFFGNDLIMIIASRLFLVPLERNA